MVFLGYPQKLDSIEDARIIPSSSSPTREHWARRRISQPKRETADEEVGSRNGSRGAHVRPDGQGRRSAGHSGGSGPAGLRRADAGGKFDAGARLAGLRRLRRHRRTSTAVRAERDDGERPGRDGERDFGEQRHRRGRQGRRGPSGRDDQPRFRARPDRDLLLGGQRRLHQHHELQLERHRHQPAARGGPRQGRPDEYGGFGEHRLDRRRAGRPLPAGPGQGRLADRWRRSLRDQGGPPVLDVAQLALRASARSADKSD